MQNKALKRRSRCAKIVDTHAAAPPLSLAACAPKEGEAVLSMNPFSAVEMTDPASDGGGDSPELTVRFGSGALLRGQRQ